MKGTQKSEIKLREKYIDDLLLVENPPKENKQQRSSDSESLTEE